MTEGSNWETGESPQPQPDASASSTTPSEPVQLDLFDRGPATADGSKRRPTSQSRAAILSCHPLPIWRPTNGRLKKLGRRQSRRRAQFPRASPEMTEAPSIFANWAGVYRRRGYWPRPITLGSKACHLREWQKPDSELSEATLASWLTLHAILHSLYSLRVQAYASAHGVSGSHRLSPSRLDSPHGRLILSDAGRQASRTPAIPCAAFDAPTLRVLQASSGSRARLPP
jgi:hypothetical protein